MQVRYVPKINHLADQIAKQRLDEILGIKTLPTEMPILFRPNGDPINLSH